MGFNVLAPGHKHCLTFQDGVQLRILALSRDCFYMFNLDVCGWGTPCSCCEASSLTVFYRYVERGCGVERKLATRKRRKRKRKVRKITSEKILKRIKNGASAFSLLNLLANFKILIELVSLKFQLASFCYN